VPHLAIVLPGREYGPLGPALRLPRLAVEETGAEIVEVTYPTIPAADDARSWESLQQAVNRQIISHLSNPPDRITFIAKSLGTVVLSALPAGLPFPASVSAVWLTPIFGWERVRSGAVARAWPSLLVAGAADSLHEPQHHEAVAAAIGATSVVLPSADHLLEVPGDVMATLDGFRTLTESVRNFVR
jgi:predicted alpha/beta hydrolase family esterase